MSKKTNTIERIKNIEEIRNTILSMYLSHLIVFCVVIARYLHLKLKENGNWVRIHAILSLLTRREELTHGQLVKLILRSRNGITQLISDLENDGLFKAAI
jgi:hypothetical protein